MQQNHLGCAAARAARRAPRSRRSRFRSAAASGALLAASLCGARAAQAVVVFGQLDDFEDGTTMGWSHAAPSPVPPTNIPTGGPQGADDNYLQNVSTGGLGAGSRHIVFNQAQWTGNYTSAGVTRITGFMRNFGPGDLFMRVGVEGGTLNTRYASTNAISLPSGGSWTPVTFDLTASSLTAIAGTEDLATVLANVVTLRLLSAQNASFMGDAVQATLGIDNLRALRLQGDANFDGNVNLNDFNVLATNFGATGSATWQQGDFNFDGNVNLNDFNLLAANFGLSISGPSVSAGDWAALGAAVPEPGLGCVMVGALAALGVRRRRS